METLSKLHFAKLQGTGNDFIFLLAKDLEQPLSPKNVENLCSRRTGVGADGVVVVQQKESTQFAWRYLNADGGEVDMCGNAARCMARFVATEFDVSEFSFSTNIGNIQARIEADPVISYEAQLSVIDTFENICGGEYGSGVFLNTGVPHCVIRVNELSSLQGQEAKLKPFITSPEFGDGGANLTFYSEKSGELDSVTFERGVNNFTLSCGTGAIASAFVHQGSDNFEQVVKVPGGRLNVTYNSGRVTLGGPAKYVYKGML